MSLIAIAGVILNNNHRKSCFYLWILSNAVFGGMHIFLQCYSLAGRDFVFLILACHGLYKWSKYQQFFKEKNAW